MSYYDYRSSRLLEGEGYPFYALIMAAMRQADTPNTSKLREAWPDVYAELLERYHSPGGVLEGESVPE